MVLRRDGPVRRQLSRLRHLLLDDTASRLVRPYLTAHEQEQEQDRQRHRRLALVLAADFGIDLDLHVVGARKAAA
ncbi:hypothetical protein GCM10022384_46780 [Streptomyces marokkonensis]|uniref:Uncharacterized protein n=1 Tax=Streptomyces marokkonensis TaxID=324855 RepID=A0ABP7R7V3_9ACTN